MPMTSATNRLLDAMRFRCIGPPRGGRVVAVAGDPAEPAVFYFGAVAGGIWKTEDAGVTWENVSDGYLKTSSVGALAVSDSDPNVIYAGMGESTIRADVSHGDGVWKSTDRGRSWVHVGLADTRHVSEIRIHPRDPDRVYVAALGHAFGPHPERGVYRSTDGGASWERVLYRDERSEQTSPSRCDRSEQTSPSRDERTEQTSPSWHDRTGAADLALDTRNPTILYASLWTVHRNFWELASGGPGSGLWRSTDSGTTWTGITANLGLPATAVLGKIGVAASPARDGRVWALVESDTAPGLYRSEDFGETWTLASDRQDLRYRPWYYMHVFADPQDEDTVYVNNLQMWKSTDAGAHFTPVPTPHGDNHDLWIDPRDNRRMIQGNDGGANVSYNAGASWSSVYNQLTAQLYTVDTDGRAPHYLVYGTQQDNSSIGVPSGTNDGAITWADCRVAGTGESGYVAVDPRDPDVLYVGAVGSSPGGGGALQRYDHRTGQIRLVNVWPEHHGGIGPGELRYRFGWTFPIRFSPHDPKVLYTGGNRVFRSTDEGQSWEPISPDLTRAAADKLGPSGGPITLDTSGAEHYCTLYTLAESPHEPGVLWAGSDDGLVHLSRDGGRSWRDVTPPDLPEWAFIRTVEPSSHAPGALYLAATRYKLDDPAPYLYRTADYGERWQAITGSGDCAIPPDDYTRVIRADPGCPGVLYAGTETGLYVSLDDGATWRRWRSNFPVTPVYDLKIEGTDLVIATHGRSFWILDDLTPLHQARKNGAVHPGPPYRCPIPGCKKVFQRSRSGWDAHVASSRLHPDWHPEIGDPEQRKERFKDEYPHWFDDRSIAGANTDSGAGSDTGFLPGANCDPVQIGLYAPRRTWRLLPDVMGFITGTDGKDYSIGLGKAATYVASRNDAGLVERRFLDAGEAAPIGAIVYYTLPEDVAAEAQAGAGRDDSTSAASATSDTTPATPAASESAVSAGGATEGQAAGKSAEPGLADPIAPATAPATSESTASSVGGAAPPCSLAFFDAEGTLIREFRPKPAGHDKLDDEDKALDPGPWMPVRAGVNRFIWDLRYPGAIRLRGNKTGEEAERGPLVLPGTYQVHLTVGEHTLTESFEVANDPRSPASFEELRDQLDCLLAIRDKISAAYEGVQRIRETTGEIERWCARLARRDGHDAALEAGKALCEALAAVESALILPGRQTDTFGLNRRVRLNAALASVISIVDSADARPTAQARALAEKYMTAIDAELDRLAAFLGQNLSIFNRLVGEVNLPPVDPS